MKRALNKDIVRTIIKGRKRFFSILLITALGVTMLTGLRASCNDLRWSADKLFDEQRLFDIQISSTLGLDDEDIAALRGLDAAAIVEGEYAESLFTDVAGVHDEVTVRTLETEMNVPTVLEGTLPAAADEVAVTENYLIDSGKKIGDTLTFARASSEEDTDPVFAEIEYTITAMVVNPFDINDRENAVSFRSAASAAYTFFVLPSAADTDLYTSVYVYLNDTEELLCYGSEYKQIVQNAKNEINDTLKEERQQGRYEYVFGEAMDAYDEAYDEVMDALDDAQREIDDAQEEIDDAQEEIDEGQQEIDDGRAALEEGQSELAAGRQELTTQQQEAEAQIADGLAQIEAGYDSLYASKEVLDAAGEEIAEGEQQLAQAEEALAAAKAETLSQIDDGIAQIEAGQSQLSSGIAQLEAVLSGLRAEIEALDAQIAELESDPEGNAAQLEELRAQLADCEAQETDLESRLTSLREQKTALDGELASLQTQRAQVAATFAAAEQELASQAAALAEGKQEYEEGLAQWEAGRQELDAAMAELQEEAASARIQIDEAWEEIYAGERELTDARQQLDEGQEALDEGQEALDEGRQELEDGRQELDDARESAMEELTDARAQIDEIGMAKWYIQTRDSLSGYSNVESDAASIQSLGDFIPLIFFLVAILIALTAMTRMVEEDRGLIGTYKALGFKTREIRRKYLLYAAVASLLGGALGNFGGFIVIPKIIFSFFDVMYEIPDYMIRYDFASGILSILMFMAGILLAVLYAVHGELAHMPATLMRPAVPKGGTRVFLERITVFWRRLSFLNKVTARNIFRYKKRLFMTVIGIMGCTGLLVCSFAIKNTVADLEVRQYDNIVRYDILAVATDNDELLSYMEDPENIESYLSLEADSMTLRDRSEDELSVQVLVIPDDAPIFDFVKLADVDGNAVDLSRDGIMISRSIEKVFGIKAGDTVTMQDLSLNEAEFPVSMVVENYLGDMVYISESCYETIFGQAYEPNAVLVRLTDSCKEGDPIAYSNELGARDGLLTTTSTQELIDTFDKSFAIMNIVVYVILVLALALAFVVLFTLSTTNISERERELATIKVLGFFDSEVHMYVNKETVILSCIGIALGLPLGWILSVFICWMLEIPGLYFAVSIHPVTYVICAAIAVGFTLLVDQITNRMLNRIDPVEALKSVE